MQETQNQSCKKFDEMIKNDFQGLETLFNTSVLLITISFFARLFLLKAQEWDLNNNNIHEYLDTLLFNTNFWLTIAGNDEWKIFRHAEYESARRD